jgi:CRP-like cAMP-binding protein
VASDSALDLALRTDALHALRRVHDEAPNTRVEEAAVQALVTEHLAAAERYASAGAALRDGSDDDRDRLLRQSVAEAWETRQAAVFDGIAVIHEPRVVDGCYRAIIGSDERRRAEAIELIEESGSRHVVRRFDPILRPSPDYASLGASGGRAEVVAALRVDDDTWVAQCAVYAENNGRGTEPMEVIERVFLLQRVDVFADTPSHHLARIALLVKEVEADGGALLLQGSEKADALYVVIDGELRAERPGRLPRSVGPGEAVGALAVLDDAPIGVDVRAARRSRLLRLTRRDLRDLLEDYPDLAVSLLRGMATRLRWLVELAVKDVAPNARPMRVPVADRAIEQQAPPP